MKRNLQSCHLSLLQTTFDPNPLWKKQVAHFHQQTQHPGRNQLDYPTSITGIINSTPTNFNKAEMKKPMKDCAINVETKKVNRD